jgi:N-acyl-D-amino-acid deacylase
MPRAIDLGAQIPHGALRAYVMGDGGAHNEAATPDDIARMSVLLRDALKAGALGFTTSRTMLHRAKTKAVVPGTFASRMNCSASGARLARPTKVSSKWRRIWSVPTTPWNG